ncbi:MAG: hypothetical protein NTZ09_02790 [Candidatus Hydrogenedentes bacterium]|nr:hypothetical protein [Candidatus Hydrogenedentota bacterium]
MKRSTSVFLFALAFVMCGAMVAPPAYAQRGRTGMRSIRQSSPSRSIGRGLGGSRSGSSGLQGLGSLFGGGQRNGSSRSGLRGLEGLGSLFGGRGYGDRYGRSGDWFGGRDRHQYDYPEAIRDAAIANAIVGVVGIIANTATTPYGYSQPAYPPAPGPGYAPSYSVPQYRIERVLVQEGRYEEYQAWVPDTYDARTGETVRGHYETRQRYIPEVWQERQVRVSP